MAPPAPTANYYQILEIPPTAAPEAITKSYRRLALLRHPDRNPGAKDATAVFQMLQNAYETLHDPSQRRAYDIGFFHRHRHHHNTTGSNAATAWFRADAVARRAAAAEAARYERYAAVKQRNLLALREEYSGLKKQVKVVEAAITKLEDELRVMAECDVADDEAERQREKEGRDPRTWFWNLAGMAARRERVEEEERRATERRHREEGRRVRVRGVEGKRREGLVLRDQLQKVEERFRKVEGETIEEVEKAELARLERERVEREERDKEWVEAEMERVRLAREEREYRNAEAERLRKVEEKRVRKAEGPMERAIRQSRKRTNALFEQFSERIEAEGMKQGFWQEEFCEEEEQEPDQDPGEKEEKSDQESGYNKIFGHFKCEHDSGLRKVEREHMCSRCGILSSRQSTFRCIVCLKVLCGDCERMLRGEAKWRSFSGHADIFHTGDFSVF